MTEEAPMISYPLLSVDHNGDLICPSECGNVMIHIDEVYQTKDKHDYPEIVLIGFCECCGNEFELGLRQYKGVTQTSLSTRRSIHYNDKGHYVP